MPSLEVALAVAEAVMGAVKLTSDLVPGPDGGFRIKSDAGSYPKELDGFLRPGTLVNREVLRFVANGYIWDTDLGISMRGAFSNNNEELVCFEDTPGIASNRFMTDVRFYESAHSDTVSRSLLDITISGYDQPVGTPDAPYIVFHVSGHFDPVGLGDERFSFNLYIDSYGQCSIGQSDCSSGIRLTDKGDHIEIYLNQ